MESALISTLPAVDLELVGERLLRRLERDARGLELGHAHVHRHPPVGFEPRHDDAAQRAHPDLGLVGEPAVVHVAHEAARAVAALLHLARRRH